MPKRTRISHIQDDVGAMIKLMERSRIGTPTCSQRTTCSQRPAPTIGELTTMMERSYISPKRRCPKRATMDELKNMMENITIQRMPCKYTVCRSRSPVRSVKRSRSRSNSRSRSVKRVRSRSRSPCSRLRKTAKHVSWGRSRNPYMT